MLPAIGSGGRCAIAALVVALHSPLCRLEGQTFPPPLRDSTSRIRWSSYVQIRYTAAESGEDLFALRRLKLMVGGNLSPRVQWYTQGLFKTGNRSPTDGRAHFQEAWLRFAATKYVQLVVGQFKPAFGRERFTPDFRILTMDRSLVTDALTPDGPYIDSFYRDRGLQIDGELEHGLRYALGVFDGRGANHAFRGVGPMVVGQGVKEFRLEQPVRGKPLTCQLGWAGAIRRGGDLPFRPCCPGAGVQNLEHFRGADRRWGVELSGDWGDLSVRGEYMRARLRFADGQSPDFSSSGWYLQAAKNLHWRWQVVAKYETFDPNLQVMNRWDLQQTTLGLNFYLKQDTAKIMTSYVFQQPQVGPGHGLLQIQLQIFIH